MSDLAEQIRDLIEGSAAPVTLAELETVRTTTTGAGVARATRARAARVRGSHHVGPPRRLTWLGVAAALVALSAGSGLYAAAQHRGPATTISAPPSAVVPRWQLTASLAGAQYSVGSGNPSGVAGVDCNGGQTCFLSTEYGNGGAAANNGSTYVSHDGGHTWQPTVLPTDVATTTLVSCVSTTWCAAGGGLADPSTGDPAAGKVMRDPELLMTTDAGATWTMRAVPFAPDVEQLPAFNGLPAETTYWPATVDAVSCTAPGVCDVVGHVLDSAQANGLIPDRLVFASTADGGVTWKTATLPELSDENGFEAGYGVSVAPDLSCSAPSACIVVASLRGFNPAQGVVDAWSTSDTGTTWSETRFAGMNAISSNLSCPSASDCWFGPSSYSTTYPSGALLHTTDGGRVWSVVPLPDTVPLGPESDAPAVAPSWPAFGCTSDADCVIAGRGMMATSDAGATWHAVPLPPQVGAVQSISCGSSRGAICVAAANPSTIDPRFMPNGGSLIITDAGT